MIPWVATLALVASLTTAPGLAAGDLVATETGLVRGQVTAEQRTFDNIPYAAPPVGDLRWRPPRAAKPWSGVRPATEPGNACVQQQLGTYAPQSEDCLYPVSYTHLTLPTNREV